jgi:hypothetical protein
MPVLELLAVVLLVRAERRSWVPVAFWGTIAAASIAAAVWIAVQPGNMRDLHEVRTWIAFIRTSAANPYSYFDGQLDYPPVAFFVLSPLGWIPDAHLAQWFLPLSVATSAVAGWVLVQAMTHRAGVRLPVPQHASLVLLMLSTSAVRGGIWTGQTVAFSVLFGALALLWSPKQPFLAALALALCSFKPHVAVGFGLAILMLDGLDVPMIAGAIMTSLSLLVSAALNQSVLAMVAEYVRNLFVMYDGPDHIRGLLSIRWVLEDLLGNYGLSTLAYGLAATVSLVLIGQTARRATNAAERAHVVAATLIWPLLFLPSQLYNGLMAAPALWLLMWPESGLIRQEARRVAAVGLFVAFGVFDIPRVLRQASNLLSDGYWLYKGSYYLSPIRLALVFGFILLVALRRARPAGNEANI